MAELFNKAVFVYEERIQENGLQRSPVAEIRARSDYISGIRTDGEFMS